MNRDHSLIDELLAVRALGGLDGDDLALLERDLAAHGDCEECRRLEAEHAEVAGTLPLALDPRPVDDRVLERIVATPRVGVVTLPADRRAVRRDARLARWQAAFGVAAAVALLLAVTLAVSSTGGVHDFTNVIGFEGGDGELAMGYAPGEPGLLLWGTGLPDPGPGKVYELWMIDDGTPIRGACLRPVDGSLAAFVDADVGSAELMAVTVEGRACPDAPTTDPVYTAALS